MTDMDTHISNLGTLMPDDRELLRVPDQAWLQSETLPVSTNKWINK